jgi:peptidoglycan/LPS O-acetylase OafA/YrhL
MDSKNDYLYKFDFLRAIAILFVFFFHCITANFKDYQVEYDGIFITLHNQSLFKLFLTFFPLSQGWIGVNLFLIISGFLIHYSYIKRPESFDLLDFFSKRFWRICPPYLFALMFFYLVSQEKSFLDLLTHLLMIHNFFDQYIYGINPSFWSLALEVQLYLIYPLFIFLLKRIGFGRLLTLQTILYLLTVSIVAFFSLEGRPSWDGNVLKYWLNWGLGAFLAQKYHENKQITELRWSVLIGLLVMFYLLDAIVFFKYIKDLYINIVLVLLIDKYLRSQDKLRDVSKVLIPIGICSYSIYLLHQPMIWMMMDFEFFEEYSFLLSITIKSIIAFILIFCIAYLSYQLLELKSIELGKKVRRRS